MKIQIPATINLPKFSTVKFYILPVASLVGIIFVIRTVIAGSVPPPVAPPVVEPARPPFSSFVAGSGIIESISENIAIASPLAGVIKEVYVKAGDSIEAGQPLFLSTTETRKPSSRFGKHRSNAQRRRCKTRRHNSLSTKGSTTHELL